MSELGTTSLCDANADHSITLPDAAALTHAWQSIYPNEIWADNFGNTSSLTQLGNADATGIRYYFGSLTGEVPESVWEEYHTFFPAGGVKIVDPKNLVLISVGSDGACDDLTNGLIFQGKNELDADIPLSPLSNVKPQGTAATSAASPLRCSIGDGKVLTLAEARSYICNWKNINNNAPLCYFYGKNTIQAIIGQNQDVGLRVYFGLDATASEKEKYLQFYQATGYCAFTGDQMKLVLVGVNSKCNDIISTTLLRLAQHGRMCPPNCSASSPLLDCTMV